jgi:hypothetical protein
VQSLGPLDPAFIIRWSRGPASTLIRCSARKRR